MPDVQVENDLDLTHDNHEHQVVFIDFDGAADVDYRGPVEILGVDVAPYEAPFTLRSQQAAIEERVLHILNEGFAPLNASFTSDAKEVQEFSTVFVGGDSSAFSAETYYGLAESVDRGNRDRTDNAFLFTEEIASEPTTSLVIAAN